MSLKQAEENKKALDQLKKISPVTWQHMHFDGRFIFSGNKIIYLDSIIINVVLGGSKKLDVAKSSPEILPVLG